MHITLRKPETEIKYQDWLNSPKDEACCFCRELNSPTSIIKRRWEYWALMANDYPYDKVFNQHDLLFSLRHVSWEDLTVKEVEEYNHILKKLKPGYHQLLENVGDRISQKSHYHIHLARFI